MSRLRLFVMGSIVIGDDKASPKNNIFDEKFRSKEESTTKFSSLSIYTRLLHNSSHIRVVLLDNSTPSGCYLFVSI